MADIIFPNTYHDDSFESDAMFKGIDWDNFNQKLAQAQEHKEKEVTSDIEDLLESLKESNPSKFHETVNKVMAEEADDDVEVKKSGWRAAEEVEAKTKNCPNCGQFNKADKKDCTKCGQPNRRYDGKSGRVDGDDDKEAKMVKRAPIAFTHPSQLSAEAVEAALAAGDQVLANTILAARHERRVRLANRIQATVQAQEEKALKLAQRKAYRESLVKKADQPVVAKKTTNNVKTSSKDSFVKISELNHKAKAAFAEKALAEGFPIEYVNAVLGEAFNSAEKTEEIKRVMSSSLEVNVKKAAVQSMVKTATLSNADYSRLVNYWKNELGYGDVEWINELFTKKYD